MQQSAEQLDAVSTEASISPQKDGEDQGHRNPIALARRIVAIAMASYHIYVTFAGLPLSQLHRTIHLVFALLLACLAFDKKGKATDKKKLSFLDCVTIAMILFVGTYYIVNINEIVARPLFVTHVTPIQYVLAICVLFLVLSAGKRMVGRVFVIVCVCFLAYAFLGPYLPNFLRHRGFSVQKMIDVMLFSANGIFGSALGTSATYVFNFILFGSFLNASHTGEFFIKLSLAAAGKARGGPAKVAVLSSAGMGTISGSSISNVLTTGVFTIPLMKGLGYSKEFSGAVEAVASTGGTIMPPVMGATAFLVADMVGVSYAQLCKAAALPAVLYFVSLYFMIDLEAGKLGLRGLPKDQLPILKAVLIEGWYLFTPVIVILAMLIMGFSAIMAGMYGSIATIIVSWFRKDTRIGFKKLLEVFEATAKNVVPVAAACACAGIIIGIVSQTGLGFRMTGIVMKLSFGKLPLVLLLCMLSAFVLGMGLTITPSYIILASLMVPVMIEMGIERIAAHLFAFYFAALCGITPPVALAAFAASGISGGDNVKTGLTAFRLGVAAYIIPYMFCYNSGLLLSGSFFAILQVIGSSLVGVFGLAAASEGWYRISIPFVLRIFLLAGALLMIYPGIVSDLIGLSLLVLVLGYCRLKEKTAMTSAAH